MVKIFIDSLKCVNMHDTKKTASQLVVLSKVKYLQLNSGFYCSYMLYIIHISITSSLDHIHYNQCTLGLFINIIGQTEYYITCPNHQQAKNDIIWGLE